MKETLLTISNGGFPPFSARGCKQKIIPLQAACFYRTLEGVLVSLQTPDLIKKYQTIISCHDQMPPAFGRTTIGEIFTIFSIQRFCQRIPPHVDQFQLERKAVEGSSMLLKKGAFSLAVNTVSEDQMVHLSNVISDAQEAYISYRPIFTMALTHFSLETDEEDLSVSWKMRLEEV